MLATILSMAGVVNPYTLILDWNMVFYKFQVWRLVTNFIFLGSFDISFLIRMLMIVRYGVILEKTTFEGRTADFAFMLVFGILVLLAGSAVMPFMRMPVFSSTLVFMIVYMWSRNNADQPVSIWGVFQLKAFWLPWALMAFTVLMGGSPLGDFYGILVGHLYYFLVELHPRAGGSTYVKTPQFFREFIDRTYGGYGFVNPAYQAPRAAPQMFRGRGRRLGDN